MTQATTLAADLRILLADALQAYELAGAARYAAEQQGHALQQQVGAGAAALQHRKAQQLAAEQAPVEGVVRAEQTRAADLLGAIGAVEQTARTLLEAAGQAHIVGAPLRLDGVAAPTRRPDEAVATAFAAAQLAGTDLRLALLRLAQAYTEVGQWDNARRVLQPLLADKKAPLYPEARDLLCETHYRPGAKALTAESWTDAQRELAAASAANPQYRDVGALLRESYLRPARASITGQEWESAREPLVTWRVNHQDDSEAHDLLCETYYRPALAAAERGDPVAATANLAPLRQLNSSYQDLDSWSQRFPRLAWFINHIKVIYQFRGVAYSLALSPDTRLLAMGLNGDAILWEVGSGHQFRNLRHGDIVYSLAFSPDGRLLATGGSDGTAKVWDVNSTKQLHVLRHGGPYVLSVAFSPDGRLLATAGQAGAAKIWEVHSAKQLHNLLHRSEVYSVTFSPDGLLVATGGGDGAAKIWEVSSAKQLYTLTNGDDVLSVAFSPDGRLLATTDRTGTAKIWELHNAKQLHTLTHGSLTRSAAFSPDGRLLATGGDDGTVKIWEVHSAKLQHTLTCGSKPVFSVAFSLDGQLLGTGNQDGTVRLWGPDG